MSPRPSVQGALLFEVTLAVTCHFGSLQLPCEAGAALPSLLRRKQTQRLCNLAKSHRSEGTSGSEPRQPDGNLGVTLQLRGSTGDFLQIT